MEKKVLIPSDISQPGKDYLAEKGYTIKYHKNGPWDRRADDFGGCGRL